MELNDRITKLRLRAIDYMEPHKIYIGQRLYGVAKGISTLPKNCSFTTKESHILSSVYSQMMPFINENELLVGYSYYQDDDMYKELIIHIPDKIMAMDIRKYLEQGILGEKKINFIIDTLLNAPDDSFSTSPFPQMSEEYCIASKEFAVASIACCSNHSVLGYEQVIKYGFNGLYEKVETEYNNMEIDHPSSIRKAELLKGMMLMIDGIKNYCKNYQMKALMYYNNCQDDEQKQIYKEILNNVSSVPLDGAKTFYQALQSLLFAHIFNCLEDGINANSLGRLDVILYPYYKKDIDAGIITKEEAFDLICELFIKLYRDYDVQQSMLGGMDNDGNDSTNDLSYIMLDAVDALNFVRCLSVRLHKDSPEKLIKRSLEIVSKGYGIPFFFNDDVIIEALVDNGINLEDARDYAAIGCVEVTIPGMANPHAVSCRVNMLKAIELAFNSGMSMTSGNRLGPKTMALRDMKTMDEFIQAYYTQVENLINIATQQSNRLELEYSFCVPHPYKSLLTKGCIESGLNFNAGGAKYNYHQCMAMGLPNVADSLCAINKLVFQDGDYSLESLYQVLKDDFIDENIRQRFLKSIPKYGNDDDMVDEFAKTIFEHFCRKVNSIKSILKGNFFAQPFTFLWLIESGEQTAATPDGRRMGDNLAYSLSPMQGRDFSGLTAVINSMAKLPQQLAPGCTSAIVEIDPILFDEKNIDNLVALLISAIKKGVGQLQFNVVSKETLIKAQENPDEYRNLAVRVSGYSQKFCLLDKKLQDHIIQRTKHVKG